MIFPAFYKPLGLPIIYEGKKIELNEKCEEICYYWAQAMNANWKENPNYEKNFKKIFYEKYDSEVEIVDFNKIDFSEFSKYLEENKIKRKNRGPEVKKQEKIDKAARDSFYGRALIDSITEKVGGYCIEPPTLFKGRGQHPKAGLLKARIMPENIVINNSKYAPVPKCLVKGHCWQEIRHDRKVTWLAYYKDNTINKGSYKYIFLDASSKFKGDSDLKKYEKARKL